MRKFFVSFFSIMPNLSFILPKDPVSSPTPPATPPPNNKPSDGQPNSHTPLPDADACASLLAYSICMESWRLALQKEQNRVKKLRFIFIGILLSIIAACLLCTYKFFIDAFKAYQLYISDTTNGANKLSCPDDFFIVFIYIVGAILLFTAAYYIFERRNRKQWFKYNIEMLNHLSENRTSLIVCDSNTKDRMTSLINQYRCDKWVEEKEKQEQN